MIFISTYNLSFVTALETAHEVMGVGKGQCGAGGLMWEHVGPEAYPAHVRFGEDVCSDHGGQSQEGRAEI